MGGVGVGGPGGLPAPGAAPPRPPAQQEPDADVLQIANVDVDAEQSTLMADLSRPQAQQPQTGLHCRSCAVIMPWRRSNCQELAEGVGTCTACRDILDLD